ncbi:MAG: ATP-binding cassette domain-containing protein, partial [Hyphomicrobiales bacterium]|nr:ATP-binding cassette domain-containing protein [Hyphomicrobiales bacterium]
MTGLRTLDKSAAPASTGAALALRVDGVSKTFGDAKVLDSVAFDLKRGEIHALLGENGAGKSTLMNILAGIYSADAGQIEVGGTPASVHSPAASIALGIGMVHQHFRLVMPFTGRENVRLAVGATPDLADWTAADARIDQVLARTGLSVALDVPVSTLSIAERQRIEILKALALGAQILVLDEPTAVLTDAESDRLLLLMRDLAASDHSIIFITHKLREVMAAGDRVSTLRRGRMVMSGRAVADVTSSELSVAMIGDQDLSAPLRQGADLGAPLLQLDRVDVVSDAGLSVRGADLTVHCGEILGLAGVGGNGQRELAEAILGLRPITAGRIALEQAEIMDSSIADRRAVGLRYIPSDRSSDALAPNTSLAENLAATAVRTGALGRHLVPPGRIRQHALRLIDAFSIVGATADDRGPMRLLSGGNAQKSVLARELDTEAKLIIAHSPTRGLDVAACRYVHDRLIEATARGAG